MPQRLETGAQGKYLNPNLNPASAGHPPPGRSCPRCPHPTSAPGPPFPHRALGEGGKVLYIYIYKYTHIPGKKRGIGFKSKQAAGSGFRNAAWNLAAELSSWLEVELIASSGGTGNRFVRQRA